MKDIFPYYGIGHFINQPLSKVEFAVTLFDEMDEPDVADIHKHSFYEIIWIETGQSRQVIDYKSYEMNSGTLFFISPGQVHEFEEWRPVTGGSIMFTADFFLLNSSQKDKLFELTYLDNIYANPALTPDAESFGDIRQIIDLLCREHHRESSSDSLSQSLLHVLLSYIQRLVDDRSDQQANKKQVILYKNFKALLEEHFLKNFTVSDYAGKLHITPHYLNRMVGQLTGKTISEVIRERNVLEAKRLLTFTDLTISEIAGQLNYLDSSYFARIFKKETGSSPLGFRNSLSEKYRKL